MSVRGKECTEATTKFLVTFITDSLGLKDILLPLHLSRRLDHLTHPTPNARIFKMFPLTRSFYVHLHYSGLYRPYFQRPQGEGI